MNISLQFGDGLLQGAMTWGRCLGTLDIADVPALTDAPAALEQGLANPIGLDQPLLHGIKPGDSVVVVVSDSFRYTAMELLLPTLVQHLLRCGMVEEQISFLVATGTHRGPTPEEASRILGAALYERFADRLITHEPFDMAQQVKLGATKRGTPVLVNRRLLEATHVLVTGAVILHYFGGFGGGRKALVPGCAGVDTIAANHSLNLHPSENALDPAVRIGGLDGNPVAEDMLEAARMIPVRGIINTVLNRDNAIAGIYVGELDAAHRAACAFAKSLYCVEIPERADLVLATAGKAKNFIQSHKALFNAYQAMKSETGRMLFAARAEEGYGGNKFQQWLALGTRDAVIAELRRNAEINGQTALSTLEKAPSAIMLSDLEHEQVALLGARKAPNLDGALDMLRAELAAQGIAEPTYYYMPSAPYTVPILRAE